MTRYGITVPFARTPLHAQADIYRRIEDLGYTDLWTAETDADLKSLRARPEFQAWLGSLSAAR